MLRLSLAGLTILLAQLDLAANQRHGAPLQVVQTVDYQKYAGTWYEIARLPNRFQRECASDVTAHYAPRPDPLVPNTTAENRGRNRRVETKVIKSIATLD